MPSSESTVAGSAARSTEWLTYVATAPPLLIGNWYAIHSSVISRKASARLSSSLLSPSAGTPSSSALRRETSLTFSPRPLFTYDVMSARASSTASTSSATPPALSAERSYPAITAPAATDTSSIVTAMTAKGMLPRVSFILMPGGSRRGRIKGERQCKG